MSRYRSALPQLSDRLFITDGGLETYLIFQQGVELPDFASFHLLATPEGESTARAYFRAYATIARRYGTGLILESPTWRASSDWGVRHGLSAADMARINVQSIALLEGLREEFSGIPTVVSGCLGPRGDGYVPSAMMPVRAAEAYHQPQVDALASTSADMLCAMTINYVEEAIGIVRAAERVEMPVAISFTVETDGMLASGDRLKTAIERVDEETSGYASYYMINCAHPTHFEDMLDELGNKLRRVRGLRANASRRSHAELDASTDLDAGDPVELGREYRQLSRKLPALNVVGGCCGTDHRHVAAIARALQAA